MLSTSWRARHHYTVAQVDVFSGPSFYWAEAVCRLLRLQRCPYVLTLHGGALPVLAQRRPKRVRRLLCSADVVTAPSRYLVREMAAIRPDVVWLPNSIDLQRFRFRERSHARPRLVWLRAFQRDYHPALAVQAIAALRPIFPDITLIMFGADRGDGTLQKIKELARVLAVEDCVRIHGAIEHGDVPEVFARGDIFLNSTKYESFGVSVVEAAASGLCIVSTDAGALADMWTDRRDALLTSCGDHVAMAGAVRRILTKPGLAARLSRNARRTAERYDREAILTRWEELLHRVRRRSRL
jgi:glycosyltransferase involved in cell wall biosynthesis